VAQVEQGMCWTKLPEFVTESLNAHRLSTTEAWTMGGLVTHYELFFYTLGKPTGSYRLRDTTSECIVDEADCPQCDDGEMGVP
jgi:hypothetical protein